MMFSYRSPVILRSSWCQSSIAPEPGMPEEFVRDGSHDRFLYGFMKTTFSH
jgi:hypothetical protein